MSSSTFFFHSLRPWSLSSLVLLLVFIQSQSLLVDAQVADFSRNPVDNFCSRWWSQTIVKNNVLYIDSGLQKWNGTDYPSPQLGINNYLLSIPLETTWDWKTNIVINPIPKNKTNPRTGTYPPNLMRGHLFHGPSKDPNIFIYGGTNYMGNRSFPTYTLPDPSTYPLWTYDTKAAAWNQHDLGLAWRPNHGAATEAIDQGLGFYLNGRIDQGTSTSTMDIVRNETTYRSLDGMLVIDLNEHTANNISTPGLQGNARVGGGMEYFASIGEKGALVALGGQVNKQDVWVNSSEGSLVNFTSVDMFDINAYLQNSKSNGTWYQQETGGNIPPARIDFCTVAMSAPDNSSHHIYLYGGRDPTKQDRGFDDVYVLSLPSFTWTAIFTDGTSPRWGHSCHRVGTRQMVTIGGNTSNSGDCDWELKGVAFLDMTTVTWGSVFLTNTTAYGVPQRVLPVTGGTQAGNATVKEPAKGWTNQGLKAVFAAQRKWGEEASTNRTTTTPPVPPPEPKKSNAGAIAGGVVGGIVAIALIAGLIFFLKRRRKQALQPRELDNSEVIRNELGADEEKRTYELAGINENNPAELPAPEKTAELNAPRKLVEADHTTATRKDTAELSGENVVAGGMPGIPFVRTPNDELPTPPLPSSGLSPLQALLDAKTSPDVPDENQPALSSEPDSYTPIQKKPGEYKPGR